MKAMILAAGLGTRLKPFTDKHPKALAAVNGKTLLRRNVEYLRDAGITQIVVNVHHFAKQITDLIQANRGWGVHIVISDESNEILETGGGLKKATSFFDGDSEPFVLMNADILTDLDVQRMIAFHRRKNALATLAVRNRLSSRYLLFDGKDRLCGWQNASTGESKGSPGKPKAFSGVHVISPKIFPLMAEEGKFSMIDLYLRLAPEQQILAFDHSDGRFIDVGKPGSIEDAEKMFPA